MAELESKTCMLQIVLNLQRPCKPSMGIKTLQSMPDNINTHFFQVKEIQTFLDSTERCDFK